MDAVSQYGFNEYQRFMMSKNLNTDVCTLGIGNVFEQEGNSLFIPYWVNSGYDPADLVERTKVMAGIGFKNDLKADFEYENDKPAIPGSVLVYHPYDLGDRFEQVVVLVMEKTKKSISEGLYEAFGHALAIGGTVVMPFLGYSFLNLEQQIEALSDGLKSSEKWLDQLNEVKIFVQNGTAEADVVQLINSGIHMKYWKIGTNF